MDCTFQIMKFWMDHSVQDKKITADATKAKVGVEGRGCQETVNVFCRKHTDFLSVSLSLYAISLQLIFP